MKQPQPIQFNKWTLALAALGVIHLESAAIALRKKERERQAAERAKQQG